MVLNAIYHDQLDGRVAIIADIVEDGHGRLVTLDDGHVVLVATPAPQPPELPPLPAALA